jgi:lysophospholipase L1-like esterase
MADLSAGRRRPGTTGRPLRVVVVGSSTTFMVVPAPRGVDEEAYPALLDECLLDRGVVATTTLHAKWHATVKELLGYYEPWVRDHFPDVLILNVGMADCQARVLPTWLYRHTMTWDTGSSNAAVRYRAFVVPTIRRAVRRWQMLLSGRAPLAASRVPPEMFRRGIARFVRHAARDHGALVLVLDIDPPGEALLRLQPRLDERVRRYNAVLQQVVDEATPGTARLVSTSKIVSRDTSTLLPDGLHRSAEGHRLVAEHLADVIVAQAACLGLPDLPTAMEPG